MEVPAPPHYQSVIRSPHDNPSRHPALFGRFAQLKPQCSVIALLTVAFDGHTESSTWWCTFVFRWQRGWNDPTCLAEVWDIKEKKTMCYPSNTHLSTPNIRVKSERYHLSWTWESIQVCLQMLHISRSLGANLMSQVSWNPILFIIRGFNPSLGDDERENIQAWLNAPNCFINFTSAVDKKVPGTGKWILDCKEYRLWRKDRGVLWIQGKGKLKLLTSWNVLVLMLLSAGSGKTVLS